MKSVPLVIGIVSVIMVVALAAHAPTASPISQAVEATDNMDNQTDELVSNQDSFFDPFTLTGAYVVQGNSSTVTLSGLEMQIRRPSTWIPDRPAVRSPFQPSWR